MDITEFLATKGDAGERTRHEYGRVLRQLEREIGKAPEAMTAADAKALSAKLHAKRCGPQYARVLRTFLKAAGRADVLPFLRLKERTRKLLQGDLLTVDEVNRLLKLGARNARDRAFLAVLWETGERVGAVCALNRENVTDKPANGGPAAFIVTFTKTKRDRSHAGLIPEKSGSYRFVRDWFDVMPPSAPGAPLFPSYTGRFTERGAYDMVRKAAKRAGIQKRVHPHLFRHSRAADLLRRGMSPLNVKKLLGWALDSPLLERLYGHLTDDTAQNDLLRVSGVEVPKVEYGEVLYDPGELVPVDPMPTPVNRWEREERDPAIVKASVEQLAMELLARLKPEARENVMARWKAEEASKARPA